MFDLIPKNEDDTDSKFIEYKRLKLQMNNLLHCSTQYCGICLSTEKHSYYSLHDPIDTGHWKGETLVTLQTILQTFFGEMHSFASSSICEDCRVCAISAYLFVYNTKRTSDIIEDYVHQMDASLDQIYKEMDESNMDQFANTLIVLQDPTTIKENASGDGTEGDGENYIDDDNCVEDIFLQFSDTDEITDNTEQSKKTYVVSNSAKEKKNSYLLCFECKQPACMHRKFLVSYTAQKMAGKTKICCPQCKYVCYTKLQLIGHANKIHLNNYNFVCEYCAKPLYSRYSYKTHVRTYHKKHTICEYCNRPFSNIQNYAIHKEACSLRKPKTYRCNECPSSFATEVKRNNHRQIHSKDNRYPCDLCNRVVSSEAILKKHLEVVHSDEIVRKEKDQYECSICHKTFSTLKEKKNHMKNHSLDEKHQCMECSKIFDSPYQYRNHIHSAEHRLKTNCNEALSHKCPDCDFSTISSVKLEAHVNGQHLRIAPYICEQCGGKFTSKTTLTQHIQLKHSNKKYPCSICGNLLGSNIALIKHVRLHTGERPYPCDLCPERFVSASHRKMHQLRAHGEKNIKCPLCENMFHTNSNMRVHFKKRHWVLKDEKFDIRKVEGLKPEDYEMFRDKRQLDFCNPEFIQD